MVNSVISKRYNIISELSIASVVASSEYIGIKFDYEEFSKMNFRIPDEYNSDEWAINITKSHNYSEYFNALGVESFLINKYRSFFV